MFINAEFAERYADPAAAKRAITEAAHIEAILTETLADVPTPQVCQLAAMLAGTYITSSGDYSDAMGYYARVCLQHMSGDEARAEATEALAQQALNGGRTTGNQRAWSHATRWAPREGDI